MDDLEGLLNEAKKVVKEPDAIVSAYDFTFQWISEKFSKLIGYKISEIIDRQTFVLHSDSLEKSRKLEFELLNNPKGMIQEIPIKTKKGELIKIRVRVKHLEYEGEHFMVGKLMEVIK